MIPNRLDRRLTILRGKRECSFDPDQYYLESAQRAQRARLARLTLRRMQPIVMITPRWSGPKIFLDDLAIDLQTGTPSVESRTVSLESLKGAGPQQAWTALVHAITEFFSLQLDRPVWQAVSRHGFRRVIGDVLLRAARGPRRALLFHGVEHLPVEARDDLVLAYERYASRTGYGRRFTVLLAGSVDAPSFEIEAARRISLPDYAPNECTEALAEYVGSVDRVLINAIHNYVGGVPAFIHAIGARAEITGELKADRQSIWSALGSIADEIRSAVAIVQSDPELAERMEALAKAEGLAFDEELDARLLSAGLIARHFTGTEVVAKLRAPLFLHAITTNQ